MKFNKAIAPPTLLGAAFPDKVELLIKNVVAVPGKNTAPPPLIPNPALQVFAEIVESSMIMLRLVDSPLWEKEIAPPDRAAVFPIN